MSIMNAMKFITKTIILAVISINGFAQGAAPKKTEQKGQPLNLKVNIKGMTGGQCLLGHHFGDKNSIIDTAKINTSGWMEFKNKEAVPGGIYFIVLPSKKYFEIILTDDQNFSLETDTTDFIRKTKISGSDENKFFYEYLNYLLDKQKLLEPIQLKLKSVKNRDSIRILQKQAAGIDSTVKVYKRAYYKTNHPKTFMAEVLAAMDEPDQIPYDKCPKKANGTIDSTFNYWNFRNHYWDGMNFSDERLVRTPVYANKMKFYIEKITSPHPDSIIKSLDWLLEKTKTASDLFKYTLATNTVTYETSKVMGYDAIFVHLVKKYYETNQANWITEEQNTKIINRAKQLDYSLMGKTAVNIMLPDTSNKLTMLQTVKGKYTVLIFWEPTCSHCKKEMPILKNYYDSLRSAGISLQVYAILSDMDTVNWKKFVKENNLNWVNVKGKDPQELQNAKYYYDVYSTPTLYVLDEKKKIIGKRLDVDGLKGFLNRQITKDKKADGGN